MELLTAGLNGLLGINALMAEGVDSGPPVDWPGSLIAIGGITMITVIVAILIWQVFASWRAHMSIAREDAYRKLAEESGVLQKRIVEQQDALSSLLGDLRGRVVGIEQTLRQID